MSVDPAAQHAALGWHRGSRWHGAGSAFGHDFGRGALGWHGRLLTASARFLRRLDAALQELQSPVSAGAGDNLAKKLYHLVEELLVFHWGSFVVKVWDFLSTCALVIGVTSLIPIDSEGTLMLPLWGCLSLIAFGAVSELLLFVYRRAQ